MNNDIINDIFLEKYHDYINEKISELLSNNPKIVTDNSILEIEYEINGQKKDIYSLASERDIKNMQYMSKKNEIDYKISQNIINSSEYNNEIDKIEKEYKELNLLYDDLIFNIIRITNMEDIEKSIIEHNLNEIDLDRLAKAIDSVSNNKIEEFRRNNKEFISEKISYWNYKYNKISKEISKARELESFINKLKEEK